MIITHPETGEKVDVASINIGAKCSDQFGMDIVDRTGKILSEFDGYVPSGLNIGSGDYLKLKIDVDTGKILNWEKIKLEVIEGLIGCGLTKN